jgi:GntR family transcriptional regulator, transcriptional repressor for pyruvate dehydrogenase complex
MERRSLPDYVADQLRELVEQRKLRPGQQLPSIRRLAAHYGISIPTLRTALNTLAYLGLIELRQGAGCFVSPRPPKPEALSVGLERAGRAQLHSLRRMLEPEAAALTAARADPVLASELRFWAMERERRASLGSVAGLVDADAHFHRLLVAGSRSSLVTRLHDRVIERLHEADLRHARRRLDHPELAGWHRSLVEAVSQGDGAAANRLAAALAAIETDHRSHPPRAGPVSPLR